MEKRFTSTRAHPRLNVVTTTGLTAYERLFTLKSSSVGFMDDEFRRAVSADRASDVSRALAGSSWVGTPILEELREE